MEINNNIEPSAIFYNFEVYSIEENNTWKESVVENKSIVVLLKKANTADLDLLNKIFKAVGKNLTEEVCVINTSVTIPYKELIKNFNFKKVLIFGIRPQEIGLHLNINIYQTLIFQKVQFLFSDNLEVIANDLPKKKKLWEQLKKMFK